MSILRSLGARARLAVTVASAATIAVVGTGIAFVAASSATAAAPQAYSVYKDQLNFNWLGGTVQARLPSLPSGQYVITAKASVTRRRRDNPRRRRWL